MKKNLYSPPITFLAERDESDELLFRGYASTFGNRHFNGFVFEPGAFAESLEYGLSPRDQFRGHRGRIRRLRTGARPVKWCKSAASCLGSYRLKRWNYWNR